MQTEVVSGGGFYASTGRAFNIERELVALVETIGLGNYYFHSFPCKVIRVAEDDIQNTLASQ